MTVIGLHILYGLMSQRVHRGSAVRDGMIIIQGGYIIVRGLKVVFVMGYSGRTVK